MKKHPIYPVLLLVAIGASTPSPAGAMCVTGTPRLLEAELVACENPRAAAEERLEQSKGQRRLLGTGLDGIMAARPAQLLTLRVVRSQQLSEDPRSQDELTRGPWTSVEKPEEKQFLLLDAKGCEGLEAGSRRIFLEELTCCDVMPPQDLACLLQIPALVVPPESLLKALAEGSAGAEKRSK